MPFLATSYAESAKLWKVSRKAIEERFAKQGMMVLYAVPWPPQGIYSSKPLNSAADMKGLKMRTYNPYTSRIAELAGAQPVTIQAAELAQAFATGAVNANITSGATGYDTKAWEVVKNYYDTQAWLPKNVVFVNKKAFDALDKATQDAAAQGRRRRRDARLEDLRGEDRLVPRRAEEERHERGRRPPRSSRPTSRRSAPR